MLRVADHFERHETKLRGGNAAKLERLRETEGTVLLHVDVALKQDASLATAVLRAMSKDLFKPTPFMVSARHSAGACRQLTGGVQLAFLLAMSRSHRHEEAALKLVMHLISVSLHDEGTSWPRTHVCVRYD